MEAAQGRLLARPGTPAGQAAGEVPIGLQRLGLSSRAGSGGGRDGLLYVPTGYQAGHPAPLVLMLHGAGGTAQHGLNPLMSYADAAGLILLAPDSRSRTWDVLLGGYGPDIRFINEALAQTFGRYAVDPARVAVEGFSDGASYALSIGLTNGDLFSHVIAFSPGFMAPATRRGKPQLYITHGLHDETLPIDLCSRRIVPQVERAGYTVWYCEFDGPHTVPPALAQAAVDWFMEANA